VWAGYHNLIGSSRLRRISIAATNLVSAAALKVGGALALGRVMHVVAYDPEDHDAPDVIKEEKERERRERARRREREAVWTTMKRMVVMGGWGGGGGGRWRWWTRRSRMKTWTMAAMAGAAMAAAGGGREIEQGQQ
jgi:hypothetical protein